MHCASTMEQSQRDHSSKDLGMTRCLLLADGDVAAVVAADGVEEGRGHDALEHAGAEQDGRARQLALVQVDVLVLVAYRDKSIFSYTVRRLTLFFQHTIYIQSSRLSDFAYLRDNKAKNKAHNRLRASYSSLAHQFCEFI